MGLFNTKTLLLAVLAVVLVNAPVSHFAGAQNLDEAIDAELDEVSGSGLETKAPSTAPATASKSGLEDIQLDEGEANSSAPKQAEIPVSEKPAPVIEAGPIVKAPDSNRGGDVVIDAPNSSYEKRLGQLTRGFKQVPDVNWDEIIGERRQENYSLQRGDTLWDISQTFFGDGFFWAKLWSQNGVIENPHQIVRGKAIRFVAGTEGDAPAIGVMDVRVASNSEVISMNPLSEPQQVAPTYREQVQAEVTQAEIENGIVVENEELIPAPDIPPGEKRIDTLKTLPKSFKETRVELNSRYDSSGLEIAPPRNADRAASIFVNSYVLDQAPGTIGRIDEIETQERVASNGQGVFVRLNKEVQQGSRVSFIRLRGKPKGSTGPVVDVLGIGIVDGVVKESSNTYHVTITTTLAPVEKGALVLEEAPPLIQVDRVGRRSEARVRIIGGEFDDQRKLLGAPAVVYLGGGQNMGLQRGDILGIEARRGTRRETRYPNYSHAIAVLKIADVRSNVATALVVSAIEPITIGDFTSGALPEGKGGLHAETADQATSAFGRKEPLDIP